MSISVPRHNKYYIIEDKAMIKACKKLRLDYHKKLNEFHEFSQSIGGKAIQIGFDGYLAGIVFPWGRHPAGWRKPKCGGVAAYPMKKSDWREQMRAIGKTPNQSSYVPELFKCPTSVSYRYGSVTGSSIINYSVDPIGVYWYSASSPFLAVMPDVHRKLKLMRIEHPDIIFEGDVEKWEIPSGLREILPEEWDLMTAKHNQKEQENV